ncbi:MAG: hypothetical protein OEY85_15315 [Rhodospirillales bacterium]|nr:hypothetical protein [Rhodospirillales bacterium]
MVVAQGGPHAPIITSPWNIEDNAIVLEPNPETKKRAMITLSRKEKEVWKHVEGVGGESDSKSQHLGIEFYFYDERGRLMYSTELYTGPRTKDAFNGTTIQPKHEKYILAAEREWAQSGGR